MIIEPENNVTWHCRATCDVGISNQLVLTDPIMINGIYPSAISIATRIQGVTESKVQKSKIQFQIYDKEFSSLPAPEK